MSKKNWVRVDFVKARQQCQHLKIKYGSYLILLTCGILVIFRYKKSLSKYPNQYIDLSSVELKPKISLSFRLRPKKEKKEKDNEK